MPKSKTRKPARPVADRPAAPMTPERALEMASLALTEASLQIVQQAEIEVTRAVRSGDEAAVTAALAVHHHLRTASLGMLVSYSLLAGLPDPREGYAA